jgi:hypothetical protein
MPGKVVLENIQPVELIRPFEDLEQLGVPEHLLDTTVVAQASLGEELHRQMAVLHSCVRTYHLGHRGHNLNAIVLLRFKGDHPLEYLLAEPD